MLTVATHRPRNVDSVRAAAILYGDWGTSKAYVIGLALAAAHYASFWLILAVSILSVLIGLSYTIVCKCYPNGGGVYASVRNRSRILSMMGALFLVADYLVTAALSSLSAFAYLGVSDPILYASGAIVIIGLLNFFGPRHTGTLAFIVFLTAITVLSALALVSLPFLKMAWHNIQPLRGDFWSIWREFVLVIVALSGVEAIANATGVMMLNKGSTLKNPKVNKTSTPAILWVMAEVVILTSLFGFAIAAIGGFEFIGKEVNAPGNPNVRDYLLRYMGEVFAGQLISPAVGKAFGIIISIAIGAILLSAVNTAINGLVALQYIMSNDGEIPHFFAKINRFGVPLIPLSLATIIPVLLILLMKDVANLAALYAIGFVGAIATNLGSTSTDFSLHLKKRERGLMFFSFLIMAFIEITLFIDKPHARNYALIVMIVGLALRWLAMKFKEKVPALVPTPVKETPIVKAPKSLLCVTNRPGRALKKAIERTESEKILLNVLYLREQRVISEKDLKRTWETDPQAVKVYQFAKSHTQPGHMLFYYIPTDSWPDMAAAYAIRLEVDELYIDAPRRNQVLRLLRGNKIETLTKILPTKIKLSVA